MVGAAGERTVSLTTQTIKVPVHALRPGAILAGSRETVISVSAGARTPSGKMEVVLEKYGSLRRTSLWNRSTVVSILGRGQ